MSRTPPLQGCRVLITRPRPAAEGLAAQLAALGAIPVLLPAIEIRPPEDPRPLEEAVRQALTFDWILFTSANGVHAFLERWIAAGRSPAELARVRLGAIGPATARALQRYGLQAAYQPAVYLSEAMAEGLGEVAGRRVLLPRADIARRELAERLRARGAEVVEVAAYRVAAAGDAEALRTALNPASPGDLHQPLDRAGPGRAAGATGGDPPGRPARRVHRAGDRRRGRGPGLPDCGGGPGAHPGGPDPGPDRELGSEPIFEPGGLKRAGPPAIP